MGGGLEFDLSHGAVVALWRVPAAAGYRPVLQVADVRPVPDGSGLRPALARAQRYCLSLSDGVHSQPAMLATSLNHLARDAALRRGSVVRLLDFVLCRNIIVTQLEILQTECALIGNLKLYEPTRNYGGFTTGSMRYALRPDYEPYFSGQHIQQPCIASVAEERANGLSYHGRCGASNPAASGSVASSVGLLAEAEPDVWKTVGQIKDGNLGYPCAVFVTVKATISSVNTEQLRHAACPRLVNGARCDVNATGNSQGTWHCERCGQSFVPCDYGYSVRIQIQDHTGTTFASVYGDVAKEIFGCTAKDLYMMKYEKQDYAQVDDIMLGIVCTQYVFQLKVKAKPFSDGRCVECTVLKAEEVNPSAESRRLLGVINIPTCYSGLSDLKGLSAVRSSNSTHAISAARERWPGSADRFGQQANRYVAKPAAPSLSAIGVCGCGARTCPLDIGGQRSSAPDGFVGGGLYGAGGSMGGLYGAPSVKVAPDMRRKHTTQTSAHGAKESRGEH